MKSFRVLIAIFIIGQVSSYDGRPSRFKREYAPMYETFVDSRKAAMNQLADNHNIAMLSAKSAVTSSIGQVYGQEQADFKQAVHEYLIPMEKYKQNQQINASPTINPSGSGQNKDSLQQPDTSVTSLSGKHIEKFTAEESKPGSGTNTRVAKEVGGGDKSGNQQHRRDTTKPSRKESPKKISATVKSNVKPKIEDHLSEETKVISISDNDNVTNTTQ